MLVPLFDTHFHIQDDDDLDSIVAEADEAGVCQLAVIASDLEESRRLAALQSSRPQLVSSAGVHPHCANDFSGNIDDFESLIGEFNVAAVGEVGLDYHYEFSDRKRQRVVFSMFLDLASKTERPVVVHCREAEPDCYDILQEYAASLTAFVLHSFTGSVDWLEKFLDIGALISFNGIVTFKRADNVRELLGRTPLDRMLLETDAPYLAPVPHRGKRNHPAWVRETAEFVADFLSLPLDDLARITTANAGAFFGLEPPR
jgi:TatD DNase family protein